MILFLNILIKGKITRKNLVLKAIVKLSLFLILLINTIDYSSIITIK